MNGIDLPFALSILPQLLLALRVTIQATILGFSVAAVIGLLLALARRSCSRGISWPASALVEFIRSTPLLAQLYFLYFVLPRFGVRLPAFMVGIIGLGLHYGAYTSEVYRAGIDAIARGQWEASIALNFSKVQTWTKIILPQAIPPMIPALGNYLIGMFKDTALLSAITIVELLMRAKIISSQNFRPLESFTLVGILFFLLSYPSAIIIRRMEDRLGTTR